MKLIFKNQFLVAIIAYIFIVSLVTIPLFGFFQKIKAANERSREQLAIYQNLKIKENRFLKTSQKTNCEGNLLFQTGTPVTAVNVNQGHLYLSRADNKLTVIDLAASGTSSTFAVPVLADIYSDATDIYGTDFFNDKIVKLIFGEEGVAVEKFYPKIGRAAALTRDLEGHFFTSGYASGNTTKIIGRDGFLFLSDMDKIVDLEVSGNSHLLVARYGTQPTLFSIDLNDRKQTVIEQEASVSSLVFDGNSFWAAYDFAGRSKIGKVINEKLVESASIDCPFPLKIAFSSDRLFYTSLEDSEGKVYWINRNLQKNGK